jgi:arginase
MSQRYDAIYSAGQTPVSALTRYAVALATLPVVAPYHPDAFVVWFDAHGDLNTPESTTTDYLGGLALSGPVGMWQSGLGSGDRPVYFHLDCDVLEPGLVPTDYRVPNGLSLDELSGVARRLAENAVVGVEVAESRTAGPTPARRGTPAPC